MPKVNFNDGFGFNIGHIDKYRYAGMVNVFMVGPQGGTYPAVPLRISPSEAEAFGMELFRQATLAREAAPKCRHNRVRFECPICSKESAQEAA